jgi:hypothetical protein
MSDLHASLAGGERAEAVAGSEGSVLGRVVAVLTPVFSVAAGWIAGVVAKLVPGAHLTQGQIVTFMTAAASAALAAAYKWLSGWQLHEQRVADGKARPVRYQKATKQAPDAAKGDLPA